ncbi:hypothetical protein CWR48_14260 [Oceanobacillus arenosus]|uniref:DUF3813 domain-containing protein n=1 Tax=Oceanobacillus arenosus TaxID=1229153 RepID=A0A3D8PPB3_9BACI|nr:hypothetical protein [Oceanobacillus arenosus]RDW17357.1 hypothetical protein CWR48_14260 [Oceanobacillus arenosus]
MAHDNLHSKLQQASQLIDEAKDNVRLAQGSDLGLLQQAEQQLQQVEQHLQDVKNESGSEATNNPQFQQAYEQLHDTRQQVQEAQQNNNEVL